MPDPSKCDLSTAFADSSLRNLINSSCLLRETCRSARRASSVPRRQMCTSGGYRSLIWNCLLVVGLWPPYPTSALELFFFSLFFFPLLSEIQMLVDIYQWAAERIRRDDPDKRLSIVPRTVVAVKLIAFITCFLKYPLY